MRLLEEAAFGVVTFFGRMEDGEKYGPNGLPLTPAAVRVLGRFQHLRALHHPHLARYLDIQRGKYDRLFVVSEHHAGSLASLIRSGHRFTEGLVVEVCSQVLRALHFLHEQMITHRILSLDSVRVVRSSPEFLVRLSQYGLYFMTGAGSDVDFQILNPWTMSPEVFLAFPSGAEMSGPKVDIWALGLALLQLICNVDFRELWKPRQFLGVLHQACLKSGSDCALPVFLDAVRLATHVPTPEMEEGLRSVLEKCLMISPKNRPTAQELLSLGSLESVGVVEGADCTPGGLDDVFRVCSRTAHQTPQAFRQFSETLVSRRDWLERPMRELPIEEAYYLWRLSGSSVEVILKRRGMIKTMAPIKSVPVVSVEECDVFGQEESRRFLADLEVVPLSLENLERRLGAVEPERFFLSLELRYRGSTGSLRQLHHSPSASADLPNIVKEKDIEYQLERMILFRQLLNAYPFKKDLLWKESRVDVPPLHRGHVWAALLGVRGDIESPYAAVDKETPIPTDRQIEVDIPRCHQYDELLSSPEGHRRLKRVLKAWVLSHPEYVYWQGLDSLSAPFLYLHFNNEALAFASLSAFIPRYLHSFFLKDNAPILQEYLAVFNRLICFHDPELGVHLRDIDFFPELYAIPWFLTMFAHVFPLHKLFHLWDTLLLGDSSFPFYVGVAILFQMRTRLMHYGFNECILLFSDLPEIDIERCVTDSVKTFCESPKSAAYREHAPPPPSTGGKGRKRGSRGGSFTADSLLQSQKSLTTPTASGQNPLAMDPVPLSTLKSELCPRISGEELLSLLKGKLPTGGLLPLDVRSPEEFARGTCPDAVNLPLGLLEGLREPTELPHYPASARLLRAKGHSVIVVLAKRTEQMAKGAELLIRMGFPRVCTLHKGVDVFRSANLLAIPPADI